MKTIFIVVTLFFASCSKPSEVPNVSEERRSIASLKTIYSGAPTEIRDDIFIVGSVISSDRDGNFYHTVVIEDDSAGIEVKLGIDEIFKRFPPQTRLIVRCQGLWLGSYGGTLQIGARPTQTYENEALTENQTAEHLVVDADFHDKAVPRTLQISTLSPRDISTLAAFENVRFADEEQGLEWSEPDVDTDRHLVDSQGDTLVVRTSSYAGFASWTLPSGEGRIEGVVGNFAGKYQLIVVDGTSFLPNFD